MSQLITFILLGLGAGAFTAGLGLSLVLSYRGSGTINLAAGAMAMLSAYVYYGLRVTGTIALPPLPLLPATVDLGTSLSIPAALVVAVGATALVGFLFDVLVLRALRTAPPLSRLIASLALLLLLQSSALLRFGVDALNAPPVLAAGSVTVFGTPVATDRLLLAVAVLLLAAALAVLYRRSRFGIATAAAAENEASALRFGLSPRRSSVINSVAAAALAGLLGALFAAMSQLDSTNLAYAVIPALAAALIGRFRSFLTVALAGFGLGVLDSVVQWCQSQPWFPAPGGLPLTGGADLLAFLVIAVVVFSREDAVPARGTVTESRLPPSPAPRNVARVTAGLVPLVLVGLQVLPSAYRQGLVNSLIGAVLCLSLVVITGLMGQVTVLHAGLAGVAALVVADLGADSGLPFPVVPILGVLAALVVGLLTALPALRVRGVQLAIVTMSGALALSSVLFENTRVGFDPISSDPAIPRVLGLDLGPTNAAFTLAGGSPGALFGTCCLVVCLAIALMVVALRRSILGKRMLAVRSNERAAAAAGIDARRTKLVAYAVSSAIAGVAGVLLSYNYGSSSAANYNITIALAFIGFAYVGGISTVQGALIGGLFVTQSIAVQVLDDLVGLSPDASLVLASALLLVTVVANPGGLALAPPPWRPALRALDRTRLALTRPAQRTGVS